MDGFNNNDNGFEAKAIQDSSEDTAIKEQTSDLGEFEIVEEFSPDELMCLLRDVAMEEPVLLHEPTRVRVGLPYGELNARTLEPACEWNEEKPRSEFFLEVTIKTLQLNAPELLKEMTLRFPRCKIYTNLSNNLCIGSVFSVTFGVTAQQAEYLIKSFLEEAIMASSYKEVVEPEVTHHIKTPTSH